MKHKAGAWRLGKLGGTVVVDSRTDAELISNFGYGHDDIDYYGGYLVCESIATKEIAQAITALPDLVAACKRAKQFIENGVEFGYIRLPDKPDPAFDTLPEICAAIAKAEETP